MTDGTAASPRPIEVRSDAAGPGGLETLVVGDGVAQVSLVPGLGGKLTSLVSLRTQAEYVWKDPARPVRPVPPGTGYGDADASGIDDCFPTVDPCEYPLEPFRGTTIGDHGDLWPRPWSWSATETAVELAIDGPNLPYRLTRTLCFDAPGSLLLSYRLDSRSEHPLAYQWTAHPLLRAEPGLRIEMAPEQPCRTVFAAGGRIDVGPSWTWPLAPGIDGPLDMSTAGAPDVGVNEKWWTAMPPDGCRLVYPSTGEQLHVTSDTSWLAMCVDYGGWPADSPAYWVAPEASTSGWDTLTESVEKGTHNTLAPGATDRWWWRLALSPA